MAHPNVAGLFPSFRNPDHFDVTASGRYICVLCPKDNTPPTFRTEEEAFAHETSEPHQFCVNLERDNPWARDAADYQRSADWGSEAAARHEPTRTLEELRGLEYRKRVEKIPEAVGKWQAQLAPFVEKGEMLGPDQRLPPKRRSKGQRLAAKRQSKSVSEESSSSGPNPSSPTSPSNPSASSPFTSRPTNTFPKPSRPVTVSAPFSAVPLNHLPLSIARQKVPDTNKPTNPDAIAISPALQEWMQQITVDMRFSPTRSRQMQEFIKLPTSRKVDIIQHSVIEVHSIIFAS